MSPSNFNPLPPRGGRLNIYDFITQAFRISTHSLLAEGDMTTERPHGRRSRNFNPLPPRGGRPSRSTRTIRTRYFNPLPPRGGRPARRTRRSRSSAFQPTPSSRRETRVVARALVDRAEFQPTPSSRRETRTAAREGAQGRIISTHSLLAEGDTRCATPTPRGFRFQPTPSSRRETVTAGWR